VRQGKDDMSILDYSQQRRHGRRPRILTVVCLLIIAVSVVAVTLIKVSLRSASGPSALPSLPIGVSAVAGPGTAPKFDADEAFASSVYPSLEKLRQRNQEAVLRTVARIHAHFEMARSGVPAFADAIVGPLNGIKTAYLAGEGLWDHWWYHEPANQPVADHVRWNYEQHVTSGPKIRDAILQSVEELEQDFRANRNQTLQEIGSNLRAAQLPATVNIDQKQLDEFCEQEFAEEMHSINRKHVAEDSAVRSETAVGVSAAVTFVVEAAIADVIAETSLSAAGSAGAGAGAGGVVGSFIPGAGTLVGACGGLLAGTAADLWISSKNKQRVIQLVTDSLTRIEDSIIDGDANELGIRKILTTAGDNQVNQLSEKLQQQLREEAQ
jgi:hypothetical protein